MTLNNAQLELLFHIYRTGHCRGKHGGSICALQRRGLIEFPDGAYQARLTESGDLFREAYQQGFTSKRRLLP